MPKYRISHTGVGEWRQGDVVTDAQIKEAGADLSRLLSLSAVEKHREYKEDDEDDSQAMTTTGGPSEPTDDVKKIITNQLPTDGEPAKPETPSTSPYAAMPVPALKEKAEELGIDGFSTMKKADLLTAIDAAEAAKATPPGPVNTNETPND